MSSCPWGRPVAKACRADGETHPWHVPPGPTGQAGGRCRRERPVVLLLGFLCHVCPAHGWSVRPQSSPGPGLACSRAEGCPRPLPGLPHPAWLRRVRKAPSPGLCTRGNAHARHRTSGSPRHPKAPMPPCPPQAATSSQLLGQTPEAVVGHPSSPDTQPTFNDVHSAPKARSRLMQPLGLHRPGSP